MFNIEEFYMLSKVYSTYIALLYSLKDMIGLVVVRDCGPELISTTT